MSEIWINDFDRFLMDVGKAPSPKHSLDRIDGRKGYEPGNCRWADSYTQSNNCKHVNLLTAHGRTLSIPEWSRVIGINTSTIRERIRKGWPTNKALSV